MIRRLSLTKRLDLVCIALAFASTGMSCNQNTAEVPPVPTGTAEAVPAANTSESESGETFQVRFETTKGNFVVEVHPDWAPVGAARFRELVAVGFYDECRFFRVIPGFMVQWGMNGDPQVHTPWSENTIQDDHQVEHTRFHDICQNRTAEFAIDATVHQFRQQLPTGRRRLRAVRGCH